MVIMLTIAGSGWDGFTSTIGNSTFPYIGLFLIIGNFKYFFLLYSLSITIGALLSVVLFFVVSRVHPHWILQIILGTAGFVMSIAWLNIEANEVVSVLESFGLAFSIDTGNNYIHVLIY